MSMKIDRSAGLIITCPSFPEMTEDEKIGVVLEVEQFLNGKGVFPIEIETLGVVHVGVRVHINN